MKGRGRFIRGALRGSDAKNVKVEEVDDQGPPNGIIDDVPIPPPQTKPRASILSPNARELLNGREVMLSDSYSDDVSSINDSVYMEAISRNPVRSRSLLTGDPEAFNRAASKREESLLLADAASFSRQASFRVQNLYSGAKTSSSVSEGSSPDKPITLLDDDDDNSLESGHSLSSRALRGQLDDFTKKYQMVDLDHAPDATDALSNSTHGAEIKETPTRNVGLGQRYPRWFKLALIGIVLAIIGAIILLSTAVSKSKDGNILSSSSENAEAPENSPTTVEFETGKDVESVLTVPAPEDVAAPVSPPMVHSIFEKTTQEPVSTAPTTMLPSSVPTIIPTTMIPSSVPTVETTVMSNSSVTTIDHLGTRAPAGMSSSGPTAFASNVPTAIHSVTPTATPTTGTPTAAPTIDVVNKMVIYLTAGKLEAGVDLGRFPSRKGTSFLVHLGDWNDDDKCNEESYQAVTTTFANSSIPVYFVMGDAG